MWVFELELDHRDQSPCFVVGYIGLGGVFKGIYRYRSAEIAAYVTNFLNGGAELNRSVNFLTSQWLVNSAWRNKDFDL